MIEKIIIDTSTEEFISGYDALYDSLPEYRKKKADRLAFMKDKYLSVAAGTALSEALSACGYDIHGLEIEYGEYGKPFFPKINDRFKFNLSHSGEAAVCVYSYSDDGNASFIASDIGCDIEIISDDINLNIAKRFFSAEECEQIFSFQNHEERAQSFYKIWTAKEAFLKSFGSGISYPMSDFTVVFDASGNIEIKHDINQMSFSCSETTVLNKYSFAVCESKII